MRILALVALCAGSLLSITARAVHFDLDAGASVTAHHVWTDAEAFNVGGDPADGDSIHWSPVATLMHVGTSDGTAHRDYFNREIWVMGAGVKLSGWWRRAFVSAQLGAASHHDDALSSTAQFITTLGWDGERFVFYLRHVSNGDLFGGKNLGESMMMVGFRF